MPPPKRKNITKKKGELVHSEEIHTMAQEGSEQVDDVSLSTTPKWAEDLAAKFERVELSFGAKIDQMSESINSLTRDTRAMLNRLNNAERRIGNMEDTVEKNTADTAKNDKLIHALQQKVDDLENRSRRNNLRLVGIKEGTEAANIYTLLSNVFRYILGRTGDTPSPEIERAHRSARPIPDPDQPPRTILVRMLRWRDKQEIVRAAAGKKLEWEGQRFSVYHDFSAEESRRRALYSNLKKTLQKASVKYGILYPGILMVTIDGEKLRYFSPEEAEKDLSKRLPKFF
ncbi:hypothetical protein WMY93_019686 [Mugilogobius chulae]|uniref:L1 transposable element RRM domain-containing protein n=1 Tax=Mugilogobius chulae TaxID=88201 RepID=A0AAW0NHU8_9GOBI